MAVTVPVASDEGGAEVTGTEPTDTAEKADADETAALVRHRLQAALAAQADIRVRAQAQANLRWRAGALAPQPLKFPAHVGPGRARVRRPQHAGTQPGQGGQRGRLHLLVERHQPSQPTLGHVGRHHAVQRSVRRHPGTDAAQRPTQMTLFDELRP